jgi:anti-sigma regulatory factor (Ser/Thr protein kinase)
MRRKIRADLGRVGVAPSDAFDCLVAVTEASTNALLHAGPGGGDGVPEVSWRIDSDAARFYVKDFSGRRWSKLAHPSRHSQHTRSDGGLRAGGFGLGLMRALMDEVDIRVEAGGTVVSIVKRLDGATS